MNGIMKSKLSQSHLYISNTKLQLKKKRKTEFIIHIHYKVKKFLNFLLDGAKFEGEEAKGRTCEEQEESPLKQ